MRKIIIKKPSPGVVFISNSKLSYLLELMPFAIFFIIWYSTLFRNFKNGFDAGTLIPALAPLIFVANLSELFKRVFRGETFSLDRARNVFARNGKTIAPLSEIESLQVRTLMDMDNGRHDDYRLSIFLKGGSKIRIGQTADYNEALEVANEVASMFGVPVLQKETGLTPDEFPQLYKREGK